MLRRTGFCFSRLVAAEQLDSEVIVIEYVYCCGSN